MTDQKFPVAEIFWSIQGEGYYAGHPATFIRLAGCNLACSFCDTPSTSVPMNLSTEEILDQVTKLIVPTTYQPIIVLTGGEPSIHPIELLITKLLSQNFRVHLETNGSFSNTFNLHHSRFWVTCSPKPETLPKLHHSGGAYTYDEVKWLIPTFTPKDINWTLSAHHYLQPIHTGASSSPVTNLCNLKTCIDYLRTTCVPYPHTLSLSSQLHKLIGVR